MIGNSLFNLSPHPCLLPKGEGIVSIAEFRVHVFNTLEQAGCLDIQRVIMRHNYVNGTALIYYMPRLGI